ncbi:MAG: nickel pincer cofactor biosynthesis protein LarC [Lachnospiraceae bacterium]|nr:nickel pincer cofactor biosynthesis protein LarC [Lachnospiraceae bacterium]
MKTLYIDCSMGAAGDMLTAALYELIDDKEAFIDQVNSMGLENVKITPEEAVKCGIGGTHMSVTIAGVSEDELMEEQEHHHDHDHEHHDHDHDEHDCEHHHHDHDDHDHGHEHHHDHDHEHHDHDHDDHEHYHDHEHDHHHDDHDHGHEHHHHHHHSSMADIERIINGLNLPDKVKEDAISVYKLIAEAESNAHKKSVSEIHFHEVGTMDAIADVANVCLLMYMIKPEKVLASPVHVGSGSVHCAHGILPVPAPATAFILKGIPTYGGKIRGELCTPTGAALLKHFVDSFGDMPVINVEKIGYGMGKKDFEQANCVRVLFGETKGAEDEIVELSCNVDDMTPERIAFAIERFFEAGALEAYTIPVGMKKSRQGILISVMCKEAKKEEMLSLIFTHTTTIGIRENVSRRFILKREMIKKETPYGEVRIKRCEGYGVVKEKYEYEDLAAIARERNISIEEVTKLING